MFATVARTALSALVLSAFTFLSPSAPAMPEATWTLQVDVSPASVEVGDTVSARITVLRNGLPGEMGLIKYRATVETAPGTAQPLAAPLLLPAAPLEGDYTSMPDPWVLTWTASRAGTVQIHVSANGEVAEYRDDGSLFWHFTNAEGRSAPITIGAAPEAPVTIPEPVTLVLFASGGFALAGALLLRRPRP